MTIAYRNRATATGSAASGVVAMPTGAADGDALIAFVSVKPETATINTPAGWTLVADVAGGGGTAGSQVGPSRQAVFFREKDAALTTLPSFTATGANITAACVHAFSKDPTKTWDVAAATGTWGTAGTTTNAATTLGANPGLTAGDAALVNFTNMASAPTWSAQSIAAAGVSAWGAVSNEFRGGSGSFGNAISFEFFWEAVTTGTATAAPVVNGTVSSAGRGTVSLIRLREASAPAPPPSPIVDGQARITRITHRITGDKWLTTFGFTVEGGVAQPQVTPSPTPSGGKTLSELLRPVGEVTMWYGASGAVPAGWLLCNGSAFSATDYPELAALLGGTTTPNMVDVFPIGAGTKSLGTNGGAPTKTITAANLPSHSHDFSRATAVGSTGTFPRGAATDGTTTSTGATGVAATPMDVMPPWRAIHFIIRAR